eukprot:gene20243-26994_t
MPGSELKEPSSDITELLGKPGTLPVWLNPDKFLAEDFNEESCVADLRRYVPLATLQTELQNYLGVLKTKLVEVINEDYSDYVGLSSRLSNMDGAILRMRKPLMELKDKLNVIQEAVKSELLALNQGLKRRKEVATSRSLLELLQELAHLASKVEKLLLEVKGAEGGADLDSHSRLLERVAGEVSRLSFQANRGQDLAFVKLMEPRIMSCRNELEQHLAMALESSLKERQHAAALHCLHAYVELGDARPAEATLSRVVVGPLVQKIVTQHKKSHPRTVREEAGPVLSGSLSPQSGLRIFDFLGNVLLKEVQDALASSLPGIFSPGVPPALHANFLACMRFLDELELMCIFSPGVPPAFPVNFLASMRFLDELELKCQGQAHCIFSPGVPPAFHANFLTQQPPSPPPYPTSNFLTQPPTSYPGIFSPGVPPAFHANFLTQQPPSPPPYPTSDFLTQPPTSYPGIFSPGVPPAFHANFLASMRFLDELELKCQGQAHCIFSPGVPPAFHANFLTQQPPSPPPYPTSNFLTQPPTSYPGIFSPGVPPAFHANFLTQQPPSPPPYPTSNFLTQPPTSYPCIFSPGVPPAFHANFHTQQPPSPPPYPTSNFLTQPPTSYPGIFSPGVPPAFHANFLTQQPPSPPPYPTSNFLTQPPTSYPGIFSPGVPPAFHANFLASMRFLDELELMCQGRSALDKFRDSEAYASFLKRWNLSVYFSLLYQEIAGFTRRLLVFVSYIIVPSFFLFLG